MQRFCINTSLSLRQHNIPLILNWIKLNILPAYFQLNLFRNGSLAETKDHI